MNNNQTLLTDQETRRIAEEHKFWPGVPFARAVEQAVLGRIQTVTSDHEFKNFHRALCERFDYCHDERDWKRDQVSLIEHIAKKITPTEAAPTIRNSLMVGGEVGAAFQAIATLKTLMQSDPDLAWTWHCGIWSASYDEGVDSDIANRAAARVMHMAFGVDTSKHEHFAQAMRPSSPAAPVAARVVPDMLSWAIERWNSQVANRPLVNVHRRSLDGAWRQVIRYAGGDDVALVGPRHDDLLAAPPTESAQPADACTDPDNCRRCQTQIGCRGDLHHAGIPLGEPTAATADAQPSGNPGELDGLGNSVELPHIHGYAPNQFSADCECVTIHQAKQYACHAVLSDRAALSRQPSAPAGAVDDAMAPLVREAVELQRSTYGNGTALHLGMIDWVKKARAALTADKPSAAASAGDDVLLRRWDWVSDEVRRSMYVAALAAAKPEGGSHE